MPQDKDLVVKLYQQCIPSSHLALRLSALESFKQFAKSTPYQELISQIAATSSDVNERIVKYCSAQVHGHLISIIIFGNSNYKVGNFLFNPCDFSVKI